MLCEEEAGFTPSIQETPPHGNASLCSEVPNRRFGPGRDAAEHPRQLVPAERPERPGQCVTEYALDVSSHFPAMGLRVATAADNKCSASPCPHASTSFASSFGTPFRRSAGCVPRWGRSHRRRAPSRSINCGLGAGDIQAVLLASDAVRAIASASTARSTALRSSSPSDSRRPLMRFTRRCRPRSMTRRPLFDARTRIDRPSCGCGRRSASPARSRPSTIRVIVGLATCSDFASSAIVLSPPKTRTESAESCPGGTPSAASTVRARRTRWIDTELSDVATSASSDGCTR